MTTRKAKRLRAAPRFMDHDFLHRRAAADVVERLETVLRRFDQGLVIGPGAHLVREALTAAADVGDLQTADDLPGADLQAAYDALPLDSASLDLVISFMAMHSVNDPLAVMREIRRVLKPDGLFMAILPGERSLFELRAALRRAETTVLGKVAPRIAPMMAIKDGGGLLQAAGFALPVADVDRVCVEYQDIGRLFADLRGTGETSCLLSSPKGALRRDVLAATIRAYSEEAGTEDGGIRATIDLVTLTAWRPHESQPKPLKPGSATASLADAIQGKNRKVD